jgi:hypothetical protein
MGSALQLALALAATAVAAIVLYRLAFARRKRGKGEPPSLLVDLAQLDAMGPPAGGPVVECYHIPMRLAVLVVAPIGKGDAPSAFQLPAILDQIAPGLSAVPATHDTIVKFWPAQLSVRGFSTAFFGQVRLPGDRGKGTPWCSLSGRVMDALRVKP